MERSSLHPGLEQRLTALAKRIEQLKQKISTAEASEKIRALGEVEQLDRRYEGLEEQLQQLNSEGPGFRQNLKAEIEKRIDDIAGTIADFVLRLDDETEAHNVRRK